MNAEQLSYVGYCALGGAANPRLFSRPVYVGRWYHHTSYWMITGED